MPENVSSFGADIDGLFRLITWIVGPWFVAALAVLIGFALRWRHRPGARGGRVTGESRRQLAWVLAPAAVILALDLAIDFAGAPVWAAVKLRVPATDLRVRVIGKQFVWRFVHPGPDGRLDTPDDIESLNNLHVPAGRAVAFELSSEDVLHSLFVPNLRLKQDAVPGRTIRGWFDTTRPGRFQVTCAELCGFGHTNMIGWLHAHDEAGYREWLASESKGTTP